MLKPRSTQSSTEPEDALFFQQTTELNRHRVPQSRMIRFSLCSSVLSVVQFLIRESFNAVFKSLYMKVN